jgi:hypothetical protein
LAWHHCRSARCPFLAASSQVLPFQGHPLARHHCRSERCPL